MNCKVHILLLTTCLAFLPSCSRYGDRTGTLGHQPQVGDASGRTAMAMAVGKTTYPYTLSLGSSVYRVEQESENSRLILEFSKWSNNQEAGEDAVFRVTNRGTRPVLVWNVRQQVRTPGSNGLGGAWQTKHNDYPGRGWDRAMIPAGGVEEFPITPDGDEPWRVCLLYSRERLDSIPSNRLFDGTFETMGPSMQNPNSPEAQPARGANRE